MHRQYLEATAPHMKPSEKACRQFTVVKDNTDVKRGIVESEGKEFLINSLRATGLHACYKFMVAVTQLEGFQSITVTNNDWKCTDEFL